MGKLKELVCSVRGHRWKVSISHGDDIEELCVWCGDRKVTVDGRVLPEDEAKAKSDEMWGMAHAVMWLLDNVEPTASAGRDV